MDIVYDKIQKIRENYGMEYSTVPTNFFCKDKVSINRSVFLCLNLISEATKNNDIKLCVDNLVLSLYYIIDGLVQQGIYPDSILELMLFDDLQKIWPDGKLHYDDLGRITYPDNYRSISNDIDNEVMLMQQGKYQKNNASISKHYEGIQEYFRLIKRKCNSTPSCLSNKNIKVYQTNLFNILTNYLNSDYIEEEAECLISALYEVMKIFVEMGVNPDMYLNEVIEKMEIKSSRKKSK